MPLVLTAEKMSKEKLVKEFGAERADAISHRDALIRRRMTEFKLDKINDHKLVNDIAVAMESAWEDALSYGIGR